MRYCVLLPYFLCFLISSTLYSSFSLIIVSSSISSSCWLLNFGSLYHVRKSSLNILWIAYSSGSSSWNASKPMSFKILKSLYYFWSSFFEGRYFYFPTTCCFQLSVLEDFFSPCQIVSSCSFELLLSILWSASGSSVVLWGILLILETLFVPQGSSSMSVFQSLTWMVSFLLLLSLYWNSTAASHSIQLSCW